MISNRRRILEISVLSAILIFIMVLVPQFIGLSQEGFTEEETLKQFFFYSTSGVAFLVGILLLFLAELIIKKGDATYSNSYAFVSPGEGTSPSFFKNFSFLKLFLLSLILFSILGYFLVAVPNQSFTGIKFITQQFDVVDSILYSAALVPIAENLGAAFVIAFCFFILRYFARKNNWSRATFFSLSWFIIPIAVAIISVGNHLLRYSGSEISILYVFIFWAIGAIITLLSGSFIPFAVMHFANNFFIDMRRFFSNEVLLIWFGIGLIVLVIIYYLLYKDELFTGSKTNINNI